MYWIYIFRGTLLFTDQVLKFPSFGFVFLSSLCSVRLIYPVNVTVLNSGSQFLETEKNSNFNSLSIQPEQPNSLFKSHVSQKECSRFTTAHQRVNFKYNGVSLLRNSFSIRSWTKYAINSGLLNQNQISNINKNPLKQQLTWRFILNKVKTTKKTPNKQTKKRHSRGNLLPVKTAQSHARLRNGL